VTRAYNNALVLVRFVAVLSIIIGLMGLAYIAYSVAFFVAGGETWRWLVDPALNYSAQGFFGNPIYLLTGVILLWKSKSIARFIAKYCEPE
jgi:uncharacterized membrane protein